MTPRHAVRVSFGFNQRSSLSISDQYKHAQPNLLEPQSPTSPIQLPYATSPLPPQSAQGQNEKLSLQTKLPYGTSFHSPRSPRRQKEKQSLQKRLSYRNGTLSPRSAQGQSDQSLQKQLPYATSPLSSRSVQGQNEKQLPYVTSPLSSWSAQGQNEESLQKRVPSQQIQNEKSPEGVIQPVLHRGSKLWREELRESERTRAPRKRALLIGVNYTNEPRCKTLKGCVEDTESMLDLLISHGFTEDCIILLTDDDKYDGTELPTQKNILEACDWLVDDALAGDFLFFSFSGHGSRELDPNGYKVHGKKQTILPLDCYIEGAISDDVLCEHLVEPLPSKCKLVALVDACHSGTMLDLPFSWKNGWKEDPNPLFSAGDVVLISGCMDKEIASDDVKGGELTQSFVEVLTRYSFHIPCVQLHKEINKSMRRKGQTQRPMLTASQAFRESRMFTLDNSDVQENMNRNLGRHFQRKFKPSNPWVERLKRFACWFPIGFVVGGLWVTLILYAAAYYSMITIDIFVVSGVVAALFFGFVFYGLCYSNLFGSILRVRILRIRDIFVDWNAKRRRTLQRKVAQKSKVLADRSMNLAHTIE